MFRKVNEVILGAEEVQVHLEGTVKTVLEDLQDQMAPRVTVDQQVPRDQKETKARQGLDRRERRDQKGLRETKAVKDQMVSRDQPAGQAQMDQMDRPASQALMVNGEKMDPLAEMGKMVRNAFCCTFSKELLILK